MKGKLAPGGNLLILRKEEFKEVLCPYDIAGNVTCGDWCSLFHEPVQRKTITELALCKRVYTFTDFEDRRN